MSAKEHRGFANFEVDQARGSVCSGINGVRTKRSKMIYEVDLRVDLNRHNAWDLLEELQRQLKEENDEISFNIGGHFL
ncbi:MAG: hypothetical protein AB1578_18655 [Thermodesulfobacteriota bacterium]|jgi:hypothetical protein